MASGRIRRLITLVFDKAAANKAEAEANNSLKRIGKSVSNVLNATARYAAEAGAAVVGYFKVIENLTERGGKVLQVQRAFTNAVGDFDGSIVLLRKQTRGLINDYDLMVGMNKALTLGAVQTTDQFGELANTSVVLGRALGIDAAYALETMTLGIGRQSTRVLDNIGLIVKVRQANQQYASSLHLNANELTLSQQKEAFRIATLDAAKKKLVELGAATGTNADLVQRLKVGYQNLRDELGKFLALSPTLGTWFFEAGNIMETLVLALQSKNFETVKEAFKDVGALLGTIFMGAFADAAEKVISQLTFKKNSLLGSLLGAWAGASAGLAAGGPWGALFGGVTGAVATPLLASGATKELQGISAEADEAANAWIIALAALRKQIESQLEEWKKKHPSNPPKGSPDDPATQAELQKIEDNRLKLLLEAQELHALIAEETLEFFQIVTSSNKALREGNLTLEERIRMTKRFNDAVKGAVIAVGSATAPVPKFGPNGEVVEGPGRFTGASDPFAGIGGTPTRKLTPIGVSPRLKKAGPFANFLLTGASRDEQGAFVGGENFNSIVSAAQAAAAGMQQAFTDAFLTIGVKGKLLEDLETERVKRMANANTEAEKRKVAQWYDIEKKNAEALNGLWETLARGFAASILSGIAQIASTKVAEAVAKGLGNLAEGLTGNPAGFAAAAVNAKEAAAWAVVGGLAGAGASAIGGQSSASGFRGSSSIGSSADDLDKHGGDIIIYLDGVDPNNPRHQRLIGQTARQYQQRYGGRIRMEAGT